MFYSAMSPPLRELASSARPTVAILASYSPSLWNFRADLIRALTRRGYGVLGCGPAHPGAREILRSLGADFVELGPERTSLNALRDVVYFLRLHRLCRVVRPAAVVGYTAKPVIWGSLAARLAGVPRIVAMITGLGFAFNYSTSSRPHLARLVVQLYRIALRACHSVIFQNPDDQQEFLTRGLVKSGSTTFVVNGSGVDVHKFCPTVLPDEPVFLLVARLIRDKGIREFCDAANQVKRVFPKACFRILGWFEDKDNPGSISRDDLNRWCGEGIVEYRGAVDDVRSEMAAARIYVLPSYYREGTPRTVLEAMAMGRPVITTDAPGCRETVRDGWNGYLVPPRDAEALAAAMQKFLVSPELAEQMGANSRLLAESKYDSGRVAESVLTGAGF